MICRQHCLVALATISLAVAARPARSQDAGAGNPTRKDTIRTVQLQLDPSPEPGRALAYRLETPYLQQRPGNGAPLYQSAIALSLEAQGKRPEIDEDKLGEWVEMPMEKLPMRDVRAAVSAFDQAIHYLDLASRSERCTWEYPIREEGLRCATPGWSGYRVLSRILALKVRLQIADGDFRGAVETFRIMLAMSRDIGQGPLSIQNMVAYGLLGRTIREIESFVQQPGAPNLYWALTSLPTPFIEMRRSLQTESDAVYIDLPELRRVEREILSNEEVVQIWHKAAGMFISSQDGGEPIEEAAMKLAITTSAMKLYPMAKQDLLEQGKTLHEIESLPRLYVVLAYQCRRACRLRDMMLKWCDVPYWQAADGLRADEKSWQEGMGQSRSDWDIVAGAFETNMPYLRWILFVNACRERDLAVLRCVEAIRLYAAGHKGALPKSLSDITGTPVPLDPLHGRPFNYRIADGKAILESVAPPEESARFGIRYEITVRPTTR